MLTIPTLDLTPFIDKHRAAPFGKLKEWEVFYAETANDIYDSWERLSEIKKEISGATEQEKKRLSTYMNNLEAQVIEFMQLMEDALFESHSYDRLWHELCGICDDIIAIKKQLS